jgi:hypothetical protein
MALNIPQWPKNLPGPDRDGYQYAIEFGLIRTGMQGGYVRQRRTVWGMPGSFSMSFRMNTAQLGILQKFLQTVGYSWFAMDLVSGAARVVRPLSDCVLHKVRFISNPQHDLIGPNVWRVSLQAEVQSMLDVRADTATGVIFPTVDAVTPETIDNLTDFDQLTA